MKKPFVIKYFLLLLLLLLLLLKCFIVSGCLLPTANADIKTEQEVKISFIYNFVKFVDWPGVTDLDNTPLIFCITGTQPLANKTIQLQNKKVNLRTIEVRDSQEQVESDCNILFISESETPILQNKLLQLGTSPILTISTIPDFVKVGGMIGLKFINNRVRFDINLSAAKKANLNIASQLANLASVVIK